MILRRPAPAGLPRAGGRAHRLIHPLCGADPAVLIRLLLQGGIRPGRAPVAAIAAAAAILRLPFLMAESALDAAARPFAQRADSPPPVFIVGHWRSGTTFLTNLLSLFPRFAFLSPVHVGLPGEIRTLGRLLRPFIEEYLPPNRLIDDIPLRSDLPQEDELAMANLSTLSCNHGLYFPDRLHREFDRGVFLEGVSTRELTRWTRRSRSYLHKMTRLSGNRRLLVRNPSNSARIPLLRTIWPDARFVHIHRDPVAVTQSSARMFATLLRELALGRIEHAEADATRLVRSTWPRLMRALDRDLAPLPATRHIHIGHEAFLIDPLAHLERIHDQLRLPGFQFARPAVATHIARMPPHRPAPVDRDPAAAAWLGAHRDIFTRWGYDPPPRPRAKRSPVGRRRERRRPSYQPPLPSLEIGAAS